MRRAVGIRWLALALLAGSATAAPPAVPATPPASQPTSQPLPQFVDFGGVRTPARRVVYLCDATGSMMKLIEVERATVIRSIEALGPLQEVGLVVLQENARRFPGKQLIPAKHENKLRLVKFFNDVSARGPTDAYDAFREALSLNPDLICCFIDPSDFPAPARILELVREANADKKIRVNVVVSDASVEAPAARQFCEALTAENGGTLTVMTDEEMVRRFGPPPKAPTVTGAARANLPVVRFFDSQDRGRRVVFLCRAAGSTVKCFENLRAELRKSVAALTAEQSFNVVFFKENAAPPMQNELIPATPENKRRAIEFINSYRAGGPTDAPPATRLALQMKPDLVYLVTNPDGFDDADAVWTLFHEFNPDRQMKVDTFALGERDAEGDDFLKRLAAENGGTFRFISEQELAITALRDAGKSRP